MNIKDVKKNNTVRNFFPYLVLFIIIIATFFILNLGGRKVNELTTGELLTALEKGEVTEITIMPKSSESIYYISGKLDGYAENESFEAKVVEAEVANILTLTEENEIAEYIKETRNHVLYRVTPIFEDDNLVASGVQLEAQSIEDDGEGVCFNVYCYNVQPGIIIDYATGESREA